METQTPTRAQLAELFAFAYQDAWRERMLDRANGHSVRSRSNPFAAGTDRNEVWETADDLAAQHTACVSLALDAIAYGDADLNVELDNIHCGDDAAPTGAAAAVGIVAVLACMAGIAIGLLLHHTPLFPLS